MQVQNQINKGINLTTDLYNIASLSFQILIQPVQQNDSDIMVNALISFYDSDLNKNQLKARSLVMITFLIFCNLNWIYWRNDTDNYNIINEYTIKQRVPSSVVNIRAFTDDNLVNSVFVNRVACEWKSYCVLILLR